KLNPRSRLALRNRAYVLAEQLGKQKEAKATLEQLLRFYPDHGPALAGQAVVLARLQERESAHAHIAKALRHDTGGEVRFLAASVFSLTSKKEPADADTALTHLRQALKTGFGLGSVETDPDFAPICRLDSFKRIVEAARELQPE